jgi:hypothetical protein
MTGVSELTHQYYFRNEAQIYEYNTSILTMFRMMFLFEILVWCSLKNTVSVGFASQVIVFVWVVIVTVHFDERVPED